MDFGLPIGEGALDSDVGEITLGTEAVHIQMEVPTMKRYIYKYTAPLLGEEKEIELPNGADIVHVGGQRGDICFWAEVYPDTRYIESWLFATIGTGWDVPNGSAYVGTVMLEDGSVRHVYRRPTLGLRDYF